MHTDKGNGVGGILHKMMQILEYEIPLQEIDQELSSHFKSFSFVTIA